MKTIKRRICALLILLVILAAIPLHAFAQPPINTATTVTLNIEYRDGVKAIPYARFSAYRVADVNEYAEMELTSDFSKYKHFVYGLGDLTSLTQDLWLDLAATLRGYVLSDDLSPTAEELTDEHGYLTLSGLKPGLYLILGSRSATEDSYIYTAVPFMVFLPNPNAETDDWDYEVTVVPKFTTDHNPSDDDRYITRKALKIWDDEGYESLRPTEVTVQLLKDGVVFDTEKLNQDNNWSCTWENLQANHDWEVAEKAVEGYAAVVSRNGITFTITNKYTSSSNSTIVGLPVQKRVVGDKPSRASTFTFVLSASKATDPMPANSNGMVKEISIMGAGSVGFGDITFEKAGTYVYTVTEKNDGATGYTYDNTVFTVTYEVAEKDGKLTETRTIRNNKGNVVPVVEFTNSYKAPGNKIPNTGLLWWPVPVLLFAGVLCVIVGLIRRRCKA